MLPPPWIRLLIGPTASGIVVRADRAPQTVSVEDLAVLQYLIFRGIARGYVLYEQGKLSDQQLRDLAALTQTDEQLRAILADHDFTPEKVEAIVQRRQRNPFGGGAEREVILTLSPANEDSRILVGRIVDLYQPVFRYEPRVSLSKQGGALSITITGPESELVDHIAETIYLTLDANNYKGKRKAPPAIMERLANPAWTPAELLTLEELALAGYTDEDIADTLGRTGRSVALKRRKSGMRKAKTSRRPGGRSWGESEDRVLRAMYEDGWGDHAIAQAMKGRSSRSVANRRHALGLTKTGKPGPRGGARQGPPPAMAGGVIYFNPAAVRQILGSRARNIGSLRRRLTR